MKCVRRFVIVALLTIASSVLILMTEGRQQIEEYQSTAMRHHNNHRHHRHESQQPSIYQLSNNRKNQNYNNKLTIKSHWNNENTDINKVTYDIFNENAKKRHKNRRIINNEDNDYDNYDDEEEKEEEEEINEENKDADDDDDEDDDEDEMEYDSDRFNQKRKNLRFESARYLPRGHRTRPDSRLHHVNNYPPRNYDFLANNPETSVKDDAEDYEDYLRSSSLSRVPQQQYHFPQQHRLRHHQRLHQHHNQHNHQYHQHHQHHPRRQQHRDNEILFSPSRRKNIHLPTNFYPSTNSHKFDFKSTKYGITPRKKVKHKSSLNNNQSSNNINYSLYQNVTKIQDRKWRNDNLRWGEKVKNNSDDDEEDGDDAEMGENDEEDSWDDEDEDPDDDNNNEFLEINNKPPYKTYDEIIKSLTSNEPLNNQELIKAGNSVKRDSRNTEIHDSFNATGLLNNQTTNLGEKKARNFESGDDNVSRRIEENKMNATLKLQGRVKSLEPEYEDEYDNEEKKKELEAGDEDDEESDNNRTTVTYTVNDNETETTVSMMKDFVSPLANTTMEEMNLTMPGATARATTTATTIVTPVTTTTTTPKIITTTTATPRTITTKSTATTMKKLPTITNTTIQKITNITTSDSPAPTSRMLSQKWPTKDQKPQPQSKKNAAEYKEAYQHVLKVSREGICQWPRARVIPVRDVYPNPSTTYIPHCVILHRCSDDTGCCRSESLTCVPKHSHPVELYFYTTSVGGKNVVEKLSFNNHTECECREKNDYIKQQNEKQQVSTASPNGNEQQGIQATTSSNHQYQPSQYIRKPPQKKPCRCPSEFTPRITATGECQCNCFENDEDCLHVRKGKGYFSLRDRLCIKNEECALPSCEFGEYIKLEGKCPKKKDKFDSIANYPNNMNYNSKPRS